MASAPWTINRICGALGAPDLRQRFLSELNQSPVDELVAVFAKWQDIASDFEEALAEADEILAYEARGEEPPGDWIDGTDRVLKAAARIRAQGAA
jgi:hypothetical protein